MGTTIRPEISDKNKYWIDRHRYYELKHFCLQYPLWKKTYLALDSLSTRPELVLSNSNTISDPTSRCAITKQLYSSKMELIERCAYQSDPVLGKYIFRGVTEGLAYNYFKSRLDIPCSKDMYYDRYRRFFWLLSTARN